MLTKSKLGFGLMRLPKDEEGNIVIEKVNQMVDAYMDAGLNYFDTAYVYAGSEEAIRKSLVERYPRDSYTLANKLPGWKLNCKDDVERIFNESLNRCGVDFFDYYLLHSIEKAHYPIYEKYECFDFIKTLKEEGKVKFIGFSYHDNAELLDEVLTKYPFFDFVQLQLNYLDWENQVIQSRRIYEVARKHHVPIIVMEPVKGGKLAAFTEDIEKLYKDYNKDASIASWALRFLASKEGILTILSGMTTYEQLLDNIETMTHFVPVNEEEEKLIKEVTDKVLSVPTIPCTSCRYCTEGCPMHIDIPSLFTAYNSMKTYGVSGRYRTYYKDHTPNGTTANSCIGCYQCESVCPQHLEIVSLLKDVSEMFD